MKRVPARGPYRMTVLIIHELWGMMYCMAHLDPSMGAID